MDWIKKLNEELQERRERLSTPEAQEEAQKRLRSWVGSVAGKFGGNAVQGEKAHQRSKDASNTMGYERRSKRSLKAAESQTAEERSAKAYKSAESQTAEERSAKAIKACETLGEEGLSKRAKKIAITRKPKLQKNRIEKCKIVLENLPNEFWSQHVIDYLLSIGPTAANAHRIIKACLQEGLIEKIPNENKITWKNHQWYKKL